MYRTGRKDAGMSLEEAVFQVKIHRNKLIDIEHGRDDPLPDEVVRMDRIYGQKRMLVLRYCSEICPAGKYTGMNVTEMDPRTAGIRLLSSLTAIDKLLPEIADNLCYGKMDTGILAKLAILRQSIQALEVEMLKHRDGYDRPPQAAVQFFQKQRAASAATLTAP